MVPLEGAAGVSARQMEVKKMLKRTTLVFLSLALGYALVVPAAAQANTEGKTSAPAVQSVPATYDVRPIEASPEDVDRTEMELETPAIPARTDRVTVDPSEVLDAKPFSLEANYMSLPGAFRYLTYDHTGLWLTRDEAVAQVKSEIESATR